MKQFLVGDPNQNLHLPQDGHRDPSRRRAKRTVDVQRGSVRNISPKVVLTRQRTKTASPKYKQRNRGHPTSYVVREGSLQNISPRVVFDPF